MHLPLKYVDTKILEHLMKSKSKGSKILEIALFFCSARQKWLIHVSWQLLFKWRQRLIGTHDLVIKIYLLIQPKKVLVVDFSSTNWNKTC